MLIGNGQLYNKVPLTLLGDRWNSFVRDEAVSSRCVSGFGTKSALPSGYGVGRAIWPAITAGGLNSHRYCKGEATASLTMQIGRNIVGSTDGTSTASATLQLVVSMSGTIAGTSTATGNVVASLSAVGTSSGSCTVTATIGAIAWAYGQADGVATAELTSYATGRLYGAVSPFSDIVYADVVRINGADVTGSGTVSDKWRGA